MLHYQEYLDRNIMIYDDFNKYNKLINIDESSLRDYLRQEYAAIKTFGFKLGKYCRSHVTLTMLLKDCYFFIMDFRRRDVYFYRKSGIFELLLNVLERSEFIYHTDLKYKLYLQVMLLLFIKYNFNKPDFFRNVRQLYPRMLEQTIHMATNNYLLITHSDFNNILMTTKFPEYLVLNDKQNSLIKYNNDYLRMVILMGDEYLIKEFVFNRHANYSKTGETRLTYLQEIINEVIIVLRQRQHNCIRLKEKQLEYFRIYIKSMIYKYKITIDEARALNIVNLYYKTRVKILADKIKNQKIMNEELINVYIKCNIKRYAPNMYGALEAQHDFNEKAKLQEILKKRKRCELFEELF